MGNNLIFWLLCAVISVSALFSLVKHFQMLQQNSYFPSRYFKWIKDSFFENIIILTIAFCVISVLYTVNVYASLIATCVFAAVRIYVNIRDYRKSIKKLVFTARVKRLYAAAVIVIAIILVLCAVSSGIAEGIMLCVLLFCCIFTPVLTFAAYYITKPVEAAFSNYYINDAKKIVNSVKGLKVIGITGSYGKTGTKFILARILSEKYNVLATPQSFNTPMGVVRTIREKLKPQTQIFICEMGAKNKGDIKEICDIVNPDTGIITSVGPQHLETFKTVENVFNTKFELYEACRKKGGRVFVNLESRALSDNLNGRECITYGNRNAQFYATDITYSQNGASFRIVGNGYDIPVTTKLLGKHNVLNITGAAAMALSLGVEPDDIKYAVSRLEPTEHRLQLKSFLNGAVCLDDAYNANPEGCIEAVRVLASFKNMKKIIITPGLVELGEKEYEFNYKLGLAAAEISDIIILVGKRRAIPMSNAIKTTAFNLNNLYVVSSFKEALEICSEFANADTAVLIENDLPDNYLN